MHGKTKLNIPDEMAVPALLISLNRTVAAPRWASSPELTGEGACTGGGGGGAGLGGGGAAPAFATAPCQEISGEVNGIHVAMSEINLYVCTTCTVVPNENPVFQYLQDNKRTYCFAPN